jgi:WD40 repeat protein
MLVAGGNYYSATMWDLSREPNQKFGEHKGALLHVKRHFDTNAEL